MKTMTFSTHNVKATVGPLPVLVVNSEVAFSSKFLLILPLDEAADTRAVFVIVSGSDGRAGGRSDGRTGGNAFGPS